MASPKGRWGQGWVGIKYLSSFSFKLNAIEQHTDQLPLYLPMFCFSFGWGWLPSITPTPIAHSRNLHVIQTNIIIGECLLCGIVFTTSPTRTHYHHGPRATTKG